MRPFKKFPARLYVLLASDAPVGVVIRRGPSKRVCTVLWNRKKDTFKLGQWMCGRIYERRSDLSPDGKHLIYFAMNGRWESESSGAWTAISRAPFLKAVVLLAKGDCWHGGGLFLTDRTYWLNDGHGHKSLLASNGVERDQIFKPANYFGGECLNVYFPRLIRDGYTMKESAEVNDRHGFVDFEKALPKGWSLRKRVHSDIHAGEGKGVYWDSHELEHSGKQLLHDTGGWEWADWVDGRLVWARKGKFFAARLNANGLGNERELFDFNSLEFETKAAPY